MEYRKMIFTSKIEAQKFITENNFNGEIQRKRFQKKDYYVVTENFLSFCELENLISVHLGGQPINKIKSRIEKIQDYLSQRRIRQEEAERLIEKEEMAEKKYQEQIELREKIEKDFSLFCEDMEKTGFEIDVTESSLSISRYCRVSAMNGNFFITVRFSDHNSLPMYAAQHGYADVECGPHNDAHNDWEEVAKIVKKKFFFFVQKDILKG